jgi:putative aldouronate transport system permease protein
MFGAIIAFQRFIPAKGILLSTWVGLDNIKFMFQIPDSMEVLSNTVEIAVVKIILGLIVPIIFTLLLNEVRVNWFKRSIQTIIYMPYFLSWVILGSIIISLLSTTGPINQALKLLGVKESIMFLASNVWFRPVLFITNTWKEFGFGTIIYLAALTNINPNLYEAAVVDGAGRFKQLIYISLPGILPTIVLLTTLSLGNILNAGFDQIFNLYNPLVYKTADIIDTYVYRMGLIQMQFSLATAVGLMKSVVSMVLIIVSYKLASKFANYKIF